RVCDGNGTCQADSNPTECPSPSGECEHALCEPVTGNCLVAHKVDGAPCKGGVCIAGGCFIESSSSLSSSSSSSTTGAGGGAGGGGSAEPSASSAGGSTVTDAGLRAYPGRLTNS